MPRETYTTTPHTLNMDLNSQDGVASLVTPVQDAYLAYELRRYGSNLPPDVDEAYVRMGAIRVGLNRLPPSPSSARPEYQTPTAATFAVQAGEGVLGVSTDVEASDEARAQAWATALSVPLDDVLGACLCTGIAMLSGNRSAGVPASRPAVGPF